MASSALTTSMCMVGMGAIQGLEGKGARSEWRSRRRERALTNSYHLPPIPFLLQCLRPLHRFIDRADHVERLLGQVIVLAVHDRLEAANRLLERHELAGTARKHLGHV